MAKQYFSPDGREIIKWFRIGQRRIPIYASKPFDMEGGPGSGRKIKTEFDFDDVKGIEVDEEEQHYEQLFNHVPVDIKSFENGLKRLDNMDSSSQQAYIKNIQSAMKDANKEELKKLKKLYDKAMDIID